MGTVRWWVGVGVVIALGISHPLDATQIRRINLEEMVARAGSIVVARCENVRRSADRERGYDVVTLRVHRTLKGELSRGETSEFSIPASSMSPTPSRFVDDEELILFLYSESASGNTSPVGLGQGRFRILLDKEGKRLAVNCYGNRGLLQGLSEDAKRRLGLKLSDRNDSLELPAEILIEMVERLEK